MTACEHTLNNSRNSSNRIKTLAKVDIVGTMVEGNSINRETRGVNRDHNINKDELTLKINNSSHNTSNNNITTTTRSRLKERREEGTLTIELKMEKNTTHIKGKVTPETL